MITFKKVVRVKSPPTLGKDVQANRQYCTVQVEEKDEQHNLKDLTCTFMDVIGEVIHKHCEVGDYITTLNESVQVYDDDNKMLSTVQSRITSLTIHDSRFVHILDYSTITNQLIVYHKHSEDSFESLMHNPDYQCDKDPIPTFVDQAELQRSLDWLGDE